MKYFDPDGRLGALHKELSGIIRKKGKFGEARELFFRLHSQLHSGEVYGCGETEFDRIMRGVGEHNCGAALWELWHIARIEDIAAGMFLGGGDQIFSHDIAKKTGSPVSDTGNAMNDDEVRAFAASVSFSELIDYRNAVGRRTRTIISEMSEGDAKMKFSPEIKDRLFERGCLTKHPDSAWLADFWLSKDGAGIILMPLTRHEMLHLNECGKYFSKIL